MLLTLILASSLTLTIAGEGDAQVVGAVTEHQSTLLSQGGGALYGLQITERRSRACQVRAFFRGAPPRTSQFCSGRVVGRHVRDASAALMGIAEEVTGLSACMDRNEKIAVVRLHSGSGQTAQASVGECATDFQRVDCEAGWAVQGIQFYFDGASGTRSHRHLSGMRPLCTLMAMQ
ncbi:hypothetical protein [Maricaulis sp.]|uniref:hypothetical protein n=1 Tax=unclassified Maricaulis TaxID=2632371 RepID=UPI001B0DD91E|nr:hypothetical protein [Maricaulis sp.]MBO6798412.1 hypothetical protein [Maricaulis sp.]